MTTDLSPRSWTRALAWLQPRLPRWGRTADEPISVGAAVFVFALSGLVTLVVISAGVMLYARETATTEAIRDARRLSEVVGHGLIEPALDDALLTGDPAAVARLNRVVHARVLSGSIVRVKLWSRDGVIVYSDEPRIVGKQYPLDDDEIDAFADDVAAADISDLNRPENVYERDYRKLLEVYLPVHMPSGTPLLFEAYLPYASVVGNGDLIWKNFLPTLLMGLVLLELVQLPLAWTLARNLRRRQDERESLLTRAVEASERERRAIAGELHDGAVQDLVGQSYQLAATADRLVGTAPDDAVQSIRDSAAQSRRTIQELRSLLVDLYPPNLRSEGIEPALSDLAASLRAKGIDVTLSVALAARLPGDVEQLLYRAAREALRNVAQHAEAHHVLVTLTAAPTEARLIVVDDGIGITAAEHAKHRAAGHLGLQIAEGLVHDRGGRVSIGKGNSGGTRFEVEVPL